MHRVAYRSGAGPASGRPASEGSPCRLSTIAYKKGVARNPTAWRFHVLDLATGRDVALAETRSIDDQLEWLDDDELLYGAPDGATWIVRADGTGSARPWAKAADSPTVVRP